VQKSEPFDILYDFLNIGRATYINLTQQDFQHIFIYIFVILLLLSSIMSLVLFFFPSLLEK
jgi:hypothetical protein